MFHHISWSAKVRASGEDEAKRSLESICDQLQAPLELDYLQALEDGTFLVRFNSPLFFADRWQAVHEAFLTAIRICTEWDIHGPHEDEDGEFHYQGTARSGELLVDGLQHLHFEIVDLDLDMPEDALQSPSPIELSAAPARRLAEARTRALRLLLRIESEVEELREEGADPLEEESAALDHLMTGYDFVRQSGGCHSAMRLVALERMIQADRRGQDRIARLAEWVLQRSIELSSFLWSHDVEVLCALAAESIQDFNDSNGEALIPSAALRTTIPAAEERIRTHADDTEGLRSVLSLVALIENSPELYRAHESMMRQLRTSLRHCVNAPSIDQSPFAATDRWGRAMREVDLGDALPLIQFLAGGKPGRTRDTKWRRRCHQLLGTTENASHALQVMVNTVVVLSDEHPDQDPILLRAGKQSMEGENVHLLIRTAWALAELDARWVPNALAQLALSMELRCERIATAALRSLADRNDPERNEAIERVRDEAKETHLRLAAERQLAKGAKGGAPHS